MVGVCVRVGVEVASVIVGVSVGISSCLGQGWC